MDAEAPQRDVARQLGSQSSSLSKSVQLPQTHYQLEWNARPAGVAAAAFHVRHIAGVIDRLFTYARGDALSETQFDALRAEGAELDAPGSAVALQALDARVDAAIAELRTIDPATLGDFRAVGRARLPST